jgi:dTDP-4-amino-4,6-dideoxygalactose transaminase
MAAFLLDIGPGDEVVVPSFTFVSTANAFAVRGAKPVFADVRPDTLNVDPDSIAEKIGPRTKAVVLVHYAGVACDMDAVTTALGDREVAVVEDNAHGLFGRHRGRPLGTFGALAVQSFHATKNFSCGEGGALVLNDRRHLARAEILREKGTNRRAFFRGDVDKYTWVDEGSSYLPSELQAAVLLAQLEEREEIQARRAELFRSYERCLAPWAALHGVSLPHVPRYADSAHHFFHMLMPTAGDRDALLAHLREQGVQATFHYVPLHASPMGRHLGVAQGDCPVTEDVSERLIRLPFFTALTPDEQTMVIDLVTRFTPAGPSGGSR